MAEATVRVEGLGEFLRALKKYAPEVAREFRARAKAVANAIAQDARSRAGWSSRIPRAIGPTVTNKGVGVRVAKSRAPHGPLYELGSKGTRDNIRHPLFGNRSFWFNEPTRPFLQPAVDANHDTSIAAMFAALEAARKGAGLGE